jgi:hypothetical protein
MAKLSDDQISDIKNIIHEGIRGIKIHKIDQSNMILDIDYDNIISRICEVIDE